MPRLGTRALLLASYVVLAARHAPPAGMVRFTRYRPWMRASLALWRLALDLGVATYVVWYGSPLPGLFAAGRP